MVGLPIHFCAPQFRPQENYLLGTLPEVLEEASPELLALMGFRAWQGYGTHEGQGEWLKRDQYAWGELSPHLPKSSNASIIAATGEKWELEEKH